MMQRSLLALRFVFLFFLPSLMLAQAGRPTTALPQASAIRATAQYPVRGATHCAAHGGYLYWVSGDNKFVRVHRDNDQNPEVLVETNSRIGNFAIDGDDVYYTVESNPERPVSNLTSNQATGALRKLNLTNGTTTSILSDLRLPALSYLVTDASDIYLTIGTLQNHNAFGLLRVPKVGAEAHQLAGGIKAPAGLAVDEKNIYWIDSADQIVQKLSKAGGDSVVVFDGGANDGPVSLAADAQFLVLLTERGNIYQMSNGSERKQIFRDSRTEDTVPASLSLNADNLLWLLGNRVMLLNRMTGKARLVSARPSAPWCVVEDDKYVYWNDREKGIMKLAK